MMIRSAGFIRHGLIQRGIAIALMCAVVACGDDDDDGQPTSGSGGSSGKGSTSGSGATSGNGGSSGKAGGGSGTSASGGRSGAGSGAVSGTGAGGQGALTCSETAPKDFKCGGESCVAPTFANNQCVIPCCVQVDGKELCAAKSASAQLPTECSLPAVEDPACPPTDDGMGGQVLGCCNAKQKKCGVISSLRPGCITESMFITLPSPLLDCTPRSTYDGDAGPEGADAGY